MKILLMITMVALLSTGCAEWQSLKVAVATYGAQGADEALSVAKWETCEAASVGSIRREYGTPDAMRRWWDFCSAGSLVDEAIEGLSE